MRFRLACAANATGRRAGEGQEFSLVKGHMLALQGALGLTADEIGRILADAGTSTRHGRAVAAERLAALPLRLAGKALKLSVRELIALKQLSGLDPVHAVAS